MLCVAIIIWRSRDGIYFITIMNSYIFTTIHFLNTNKNTIKIHFHPELPRDYAVTQHRFIAMGSQVSLEHNSNFAQCPDQTYRLSPIFSL